jgi:hypothetical protein
MYCFFMATFIMIWPAGCRKTCFLKNMQKNMWVCIFYVVSIQTGESSKSYHDFIIHIGYTVCHPTWSSHAHAWLVSDCHELCCDECHIKNPSIPHVLYVLQPLCGAQTQAWSHFAMSFCVACVLSALIKLEISSLARACLTITPQTL